MKFPLEVTEQMREAMLLNGILYNSEAWHGVTNAHIAKLESVDESLLRGILQAHSKTPKEFLYLETGVLPIKFVLAQRRINYLKHIVSRDEHELIKKVFNAQQVNPTRGDFVNLVNNDLQMMDLSYDEVTSNKMTKHELKARLKQCVQSVALSSLISKLKEHSKS